MALGRCHGFCMSTLANVAFNPGGERCLSPEALFALEHFTECDNGFYWYS